MIGFVDDNNAQTTGQPDKSEEALAACCTHDAQLWHDILWATGGALETLKCSYQSMQFYFSNLGVPFLHHGKHGPPIIIKDPHGEDITIQQLSVTQAYKILGTSQAAVVCQCQQHSVLKRKPLIIVKLSLSATYPLKEPGYITLPFFCAALATPFEYATSPTANSIAFKAP